MAVLPSSTPGRSMERRSRSPSGGLATTLTLAASSVITGAVFSTGSGGNTLQLGGAAGTFNMHALDTQYFVFSTFNKIDGALWTLTGTTAFAGAVNVNAGTLRVQA